jgi:hypothetical protein
LPAFSPGDPVQTPLGKGIVREVRHGARYVVDVRGRAVVFAARDVTTVESSGRRGARTRRAARADAAAIPHVAAAAPHAASSSGAAREVDLHGLTVPEALARAEDALNEALLANAAELHVIHGRSGGRIRAALHARLGGIPSVRDFALDPRNAGITIVRL